MIKFDKIKQSYKSNDGNLIFEVEFIGTESTEWFVLPHIHTDMYPLILERKTLYGDYHFDRHILSTKDLLMANKSQLECIPPKIITSSPIAIIKCSSVDERIIVDSFIKYGESRSSVLFQQQFEEVIKKLREIRAFNPIIET